MQPAPLALDLLGSLGTALYKNRMNDLQITGVSPELTEVAKGTIGAAVGVAKDLPEELSVTLLTSSREAFTNSMQIISIICAIIAVVLAMAVLRVLRIKKQEEVKTEGIVELA